MGKLYLGTQEIGAAYAPTITSPEVYIPLELTSNGTLRKPSASFAWTVPDTATTIGNSGLSYAFRDCIRLTSVDFKNVMTINDRGLSNAFAGCTRLTSVNLSNVTSIGSSGLETAFSGCSSLTTIDLSNLTTVGDYCFKSAFQNCTALTTMSFDKVSSIDAYGFRNAFILCPNLTSLSFPALTTSSFGANTNQFNGMLSSCSGVTVHFPVAIQSTIGSWSSVTSGFSGTNTTVLFDL